MDVFSVQSERRREHADRDIHRHDDREVDRIDAQGLDQRHEQGREHDVAEVGSRKHPTIRRMTFTVMRKAQGGRLRLVSPPVIACDTPLTVRIQENSAAVATMIRICALRWGYRQRIMPPVVGSFPRM
jgi:hypothetical protein